MKKVCKKFGYPFLIVVLCTQIQHTLLYIGM
jgi:hypothetical protein